MKKEEFYKRSTLPTLVEEGSSHEAEPVPEFIGPYKIESLLERGGMSLLYLGTHPKTKEPTTIKVLSKRFISNEEITQRFLDEAEIIALADHPNIVKLYGQGEWEGGLYIAMEFIEGISLRQHLLRTPISLKQALELILDIGYSLCHLHSHGVIHRDLKPENVLINSDGAIKVIDFGISQLLTENTKTGSSQQRIIGTPIYMSPEQKEDPESVGYPSDIYSLGIIAYELILGKLCHGRIHLSLLPKGIQKILARALLPDPKERYQNILSFIRDITAYMDSASIEEDSPPHDQFSELHEGMKQAVQTLIPPITPLWHRVEIGMATHRGEKISSLYYDFFKLSTGAFGLLALEPVDGHASSILATATLRGIVQTLKGDKIYPAETFIAALNSIILSDISHQHFFLNYLILDPHYNTLSYVCCGNNQIWIAKEGGDKADTISNSHPLLGAKPGFPITATVHSWNDGDTVLLTTLASQSDAPLAERNFILDIFNQNLQDSPQYQVNTITGRLRTFQSPLLQKRATAVLSLHRKK